MAEDTTVEDKAAAKAGASGTDLSDSTNIDGAPVPAPAPKNKAEADAAAGVSPEDKEAADKAKAEADAKAAEEAKAAENSDDDASTGEDDADGEEDHTPLDTTVWGSTGDEVGDNVLELLQNSNVSTEEAKALLFDAVNAGDITKIDVAALEAKVGKAQANLIMIGTKDFVERSKAKAETITKEVHTAVGGEENWNAVTTWANENVPEAEVAEYRELIDAGGAKARFAASELLSRFNGDDQNSTIQNTSTTIDPETKADVQGKAITRAEYVEAMKAAHNRGASDVEIAAIKADRARGRAKGI